jgi:hypothetical protein
MEKGQMYRAEYSSWYSVQDEAFLTSNQVEEGVSCTVLSTALGTLYTVKDDTFMTSNQTPVSGQKGSCAVPNLQIPCQKGHLYHLGTAPGTAVYSVVRKL